MITGKVKTGLRTRLVNSIKNSPKKSMSISELFKVYSPIFPTLTKSDVKDILNEVYVIDNKLASRNKSRRYQIFPNKGGNAFRYSGGGEITRKGTGPYRDIVKVIDADAKKITDIFKAPHLNAYDVHAGKSKRGKWGRPDIIVELYRTVGSAKSFELHVLEYEGYGGFSPANVAQAYFSGIGANKCWLLFDSRDWPKNKKERAANPSAERVRDFAEKLGVGLIYFKTLHIGGTWHCLLEAKSQKTTRELKKELKDLIEND